MAVVKKSIVPQYSISNFSKKIEPCKFSIVYLQGSVFLRKWFFFMWNTATGCLQRWWMPHTWKHSKSDWTGLWETWPSGGCPCLLQVCWKQMTCKGSFQPKLLYDSIITDSKQPCFHILLIKQYISWDDIRIHWHFKQTHKYRKFHCWASKI